MHAGRFVLVTRLDRVNEGSVEEFSNDELPRAIAEFNSLHEVAHEIKLIDVQTGDVLGLSKPHQRRAIAA